MTGKLGLCPGSVGWILRRWRDLYDWVFPLRGEWIGGCGGSDFVEGGRGVGEGSGDLFFLRDRLRELQRGQATAKIALPLTWPLTYLIRGLEWDRMGRAFSDSMQNAAAALAVQESVSLDLRI